jgi:hypothetical protein
MVFSVDINEVDALGFARHDTSRLSLAVAGGNGNIANQSFHEMTSSFPMNGQNIFAPFLGEWFVVVEEESEGFIVFHGVYFLCFSFLVYLVLSRKENPFRQMGLRIPL